MQDISNTVIVNTNTVSELGDKIICKYGKVVFVYLGGLILNAQGESQIILTGLPVAKAAVFTTPHGRAEIMASAEGVRMDTNGSSIIMTSYDTYYLQHWISFTYLTV